MDTDQPFKTSQKANLDYLVQRKYLIRSNEGDITEKYDYEARIGDGGFGVVYRVKEKFDGKYFGIF